MEIKIKLDDYNLILSNDDSDNDNFVSLIIDENGENLFDDTVGIDELMSALIAFDAQRSKKLDMEYIYQKMGARYEKE